MTVPPHKARQQCGCHRKSLSRFFPDLCRFLPRQMLACLRAFALVSAKAGLFYEVIAW